MRGGIIAARAGLAGEEQAIVHRRGELGTAVSLARQGIRVGAARERVDAPTMKLQRLHQNRCRAFHDPEFWKALAIARKWEDTNAWRFHWHRFLSLVPRPRGAPPTSPFSNLGRSAFFCPAPALRDFWFPSSAPPTGDPWGSAADDRSALVGEHHPARWFEEHWSRVSVTDQDCSAPRPMQLSV